MADCNYNNAQIQNCVIKSYNTSSQTGLNKEPDKSPAQVGMAGSATIVLYKARKAPNVLTSDLGQISAISIVVKLSIALDFQSLWLSFKTVGKQPDQSIQKI